jgi:L-ascorbate metabolism protein UlaG (beta-lactamase superfamily)
MKLKWLGHSAFILTSDSGTKVLTDPYESGSYDGAVGYGPITERVDVVTVSHAHPDHYCEDGLPRGFQCIKEPGPHQVAGISISGLKTYHDASKGKERGRNIVYLIEMDGIRVCHLGDLGHTLSSADLQALGKVDVLLIPVGGFYTIGPKEALAVMKSISPSITIPMHFKTDSLGFPIKPAEDFLSLAGEYEEPGVSEVDISKADLGSQRIILLEHAL